MSGAVVRRVISWLSALSLLVLLAGCGPSAGDGSASAATGSTPASDSRTVTVHLDVVHQGPATLALVPVKIEGHGPYPFILDTGAATSGVSNSLVGRLHLPATGQKAQVSGVTSTEQVQLVKVAKWSVGSFSLPAATVGALSFPAPLGSSAPGVNSIAGLLGSDQLSRFGSVTIDYRRQQLRFTP